MYHTLGNISNKRLHPRQLLRKDVRASSQRIKWSINTWNIASDVFEEKVFGFGGRWVYFVGRQNALPPIQHHTSASIV